VRYNTFGNSLRAAWIVNVARVEALPPDQAARFWLVAQAQAPAF
jgi:hypothetical protein